MDRREVRKNTEGRDFTDRVFDEVEARKRKGSTAAVPEDALVLGEDPVTREKIYYRYPDLRVGLHVVGGPNAGKTNALKVLSRELLKQKVRSGNGFAVIDTHGVLTKYVRNLMAAEFPFFADDLVYLDLVQAQKVVGINPFANLTPEQVQLAAKRATAALIKVFGASNASDKPRLQRVLNFMFEAVAHGGMYLPDSRLLLQRGPANQAIMQALIERLPELGEGGDVRRYLEDFQGLTRASFEAYVEAPLNRLDLIARPRPFKRILGAPRTSLDFRRLMDDGGIALFDLATFGTDVDPEAAHMLAALIVQEFNQAWQGREADKSRPFVLVMDEFGDYTGGDMARMITGARKFGLWPVFAHQNLEQLVLKDDDRELLHAVLAIPNRVCFGSLFFDEAQILARQMYLAKINPDEIKHVIETITYKPVPTPVLLESWTTGGSKTEGGGEADGEGTGTASGATYDQDGNLVGATITDSAGWQRSSSRHFASAHNWSHTTQQAWNTFYQELIGKGGVTFRTIDEQIFNFAKQLVLQPIGQGAVARLREAPRSCRLPEFKDIEQTDEQIGAFFKAVYTGKTGPLHLDTATVDTILVEHERKLLMESGPRIVASYAPRSRVSAGKRKGPVPRGSIVETEESPGREDVPEIPDFVTDYVRQGLPNAERLKDRRRQARKLYHNHDYTESVTTSRVVIERVLRPVAEAFSREAGQPLRRDAKMQIVRDYLLRHGLLDEPTWKLCVQLSGEQGDHVHDKVQGTREKALLLLNQSEALSQFVLQKFEAWRAKKDPPQPQDPPTP